MTYDVSLLDVFQTGEIAEHIIGQDFTSSDIVRTSVISRGFYAIITDPQRAAKFYKRLILPSPFQFVPTTSFVRTKALSGAVVLETHYLQLVSIGTRHVMRDGGPFFDCGSNGMIVASGVEKWLYVLTHGALPRNATNRLEIDASYTYKTFYDLLMSQSYMSTALLGLTDYMSFDAIKSFIILCLSDRVNINWPGCVNWMREVAHLPAVQKDPVGCLYFYAKRASIFAFYLALSEQEETFSTLRDQLMQLPGFNFDIFMKVCLKDDDGHSGLLDGIKYLRNFIKLCRAGHIDFEAWRVQFERDHRLNLPLSTMTDAFVRAVQRGYLSCDLTETDGLFGLFLLLREETDLDRQLNQIFEDLCAKLKELPDFKRYVRLLKTLFDFIFMYSLPYNLEQDLGEERGSLLFSQFWRDGEIRVQALYDHLETIQNARKKAFDSFVSGSELFKDRPQLRALFLEELSLRAFYQDHFCSNRRFDELFNDDEMMHENRPLAMFVQDIAQREAHLIQEEFSPEVLQALSGLTALEVQKVLAEFTSSNPEVCTTYSTQVL